jgi:hypothetical protein
MESTEQAITKSNCFSEGCAAKGEAAPAVQAVRRMTCPSAIGAGLAEIGLIFASFRSSFSIFFCSWETRRLVADMFIFSHDLWAV